MVHQLLVCNTLKINSQHRKIFDMITRSAFLGFMAATLLAPISALADDAKTMAKNNKTVVMVHGAFADGSAWNSVVPLLRKKGLQTISVQLPMTSLADDVAFTKRAIKNAGGEVILVGHSWGGVVITEAGANENVSSLVYLSAFAPKVGEHVHNILHDAHEVRGIPQVEGFLKPIVDKDKFIRLSEEAIVSYFAPDIPEADARLIAVSQGRLYAGALDQAPSVQAWDGKPTWYIVTTNDQMIAPDLQREQAARIKAQTVEIEGSHASMLSHPKEVAQVILNAAQ